MPWSTPVDKKDHLPEDDSFDRNTLDLQCIYVHVNIEKSKIRELTLDKRRAV